jgi:hypothetical protein
VNEKADLMAFDGQTMKKYKKMSKNVKKMLT